MAACCITAAGQENVSVNVSPLPERQSNFNLTPETPSLTGPSINPGYSSPLIPSQGITPMSLADSIMSSKASGDYIDLASSRPKYDFRMDPYGGNWSRSGIMAMPGGGYLAGSGGFLAMPALGNIGAATLQWVQPLGDRMTVSMGVTGSKYHIGRDAWNDYGVSASMRFGLSRRLSLKAWGNYSLHPVFHSMAAMSCVGTSNYGASLDMRMTDLLGLELGAQRFYDPLSRRWKTVPVIAPSINILGAPISIDLGGLVGNLLGGNHNDYAPIDPMKPVDMKAAPPGYNQFSPVRIPDALRR